MDKIKFSNLPNYLTLFRVISIPVIIIAIIPQTYVSNWIAVSLYMLACITDFLDGYFARKLKLETRLGKFLDPIADKVLVTSVIFILVTINKISGFFIYPALIIIIREILVSGLREFFAESQISINVTNLAKWKTLIQMFSLGFLIVGDASPSEIPSVFIGEICLWLAALLTLWTGYDYLRSGLLHASAGDSDKVDD